jgi:PEP-CTERM/exosortase A-associated glycosyltransferase
MKVLHVLDHSIPLHSGYTFRTRAILAGQRALGWETAHLTGPKQGPVAALEEEVDGLRFYRTRSVNGIATRIPGLDPVTTTWAIERRLSRVARQLRPEVLHAHSPALNGLAALGVGRRLDLPVVYEVRAFWEDAAVDHGSCREGDLRYRMTRALETWVLRRADAVTTICEGLRAEIVARGVPAERVTVIPNAVDLDRFPLGGAADAGLAADLGLSGKTVLGFIGSFYAYEGLGLLLGALPRILSERTDVRVLLVGGGREEERLKDLARQLGVADRVVLAGRVPHDHVQRYYDLVDVFVYPRLPMRLTDLVTPLKPLEAMARGRLVVASDVGGHCELIRDGVTGSLFRAGSSEALALAVLDLLARPGDWPERRAAARRFVETERTWQASVARYPDVYRAALRRVGRG